MEKKSKQVTKIRKRDGRVVAFDKQKVVSAIYKAGRATGEFGKNEAEKLANAVTRLLNKKYGGFKIPTVEEIQDIVEETLMKKGWYQTVRAYVLYRSKHAKLRRAKLLLSKTTKLIKDYIQQVDWRVEENANMAYSLQGLNNHIASSVIARYWLQEIYPPKAARAHINGDFHIHDLGFLGAYCFDDQTRVLTKEGFKFFKDVTLQDKVATYNLKTDYLEYQQPTDKQIFEYSGSLFSFENRSVSLRVTPEHRLLIRKRNRKNWEFANPSEFQPRSEFLKQVKWRGGNEKFFTIGKVQGGNRPRHLKKIPIKTYLNFMGWYLAEGNIWINQRKDRNAPNYIISFGQRNKENRKEITSLIKKLGFSPNLSGKDHIQFSSKELCLYLKQFGTSREKFIPDFIKDLNPELIGIFLRSLFKGDGSIEQGRLRKFSTTSQKLAEDVLECLLKIGKSGTISWNGKKFNVSVQDKQLTPLYNGRPKLVSYKGKVYDLTVPNGTLIVERNGKVVISGNCVGWDLYDLLVEGFKGVPGKIQSRPAKHFRVALGQVTNFLYTMQGESAGANALSNFDTLLAPFIAYDKLDYPAVKQAMQEFLYTMNVPTRVGFQTPFTNLTFDLTVPADFADQPVIIGGKPQKRKYAEFQKEMDMVNRAFAEVMLEGDARGRVFSFPIPTYNLTADFNWDNPTLEPVFEMGAKYGIPYWANFVNSDMKPEDCRSMCCRLRLDLTELIKRGGGYFGANSLTGSIGVVTLNMGRIGYLAQSKRSFLNRVGRLMDLARDALEVKRKVVERFTERGLYPYSLFYLRGNKDRLGGYWSGHFSTIGLNGLNEGLLNLIGENIGSSKGRQFAEEVLSYMREKLIDYQKETGNLYNLEATPAEGTSYRLAKIDKKKYPEIIVANEKEVKKGAAPFYTNSSQLPVDFNGDVFKALELQDPLQCLYTGGTVFHVFLGERLESGEEVKALVKKIVENFSLPYFTLTPTFSICPKDGYLKGEHQQCPECGAKTEIYSRVVGYLRPVSQWNKGKKAEFDIRKSFKKKA